MQVRWMIFLLLLSVSMVQSQSFEPSEYIDKIYSRLKSLLRLELLASKSPSGSNKGHSFITKPNPEAVLKYEESLLFEIATREGVRARPTRSSAPARCDTLRCSPQDPYSKLDGACNNVWKNRRWGARLQPLSRILASAYDDRISAPKIRSVDGKTFLPSARSVSNAFHKGNELNRTTNQKYSLMVMQWGQFLDHDISFSPNIRALRSGEAFNCNACDSSLTVHPSCFPIIVPKKDPYFPPLDNDRARCMTFTRSMPGQVSIGERQQLNQNTGLLDASHIYGSSICISNSLRRFKHGHLQVQNHPRQAFAKPFMPQKESVFDCESSHGMCFHSGDDRSNEQPGLTTLHTLFVREHNYICDQLRAYNPGWKDETLFQEARKILRAINQHITYSEFLPRVLSHAVRVKYGLILEEGPKYFQGYDSSCSADIFNEFSTAAFRFGHTLVAPIIKMLRKSFHQSHHERLKMRNHFNNPDIMQRPKFIDRLVKGLSSQTIERYDGIIEFDLRNRLFEESSPKKNSSFVPHSGLDLAALNIQRGRDHGIPGYVKYRNWCTKEKIKSFKGLRSVFNASVVQKLRSIYRKVEDIDLFTGGILEDSMEGGLLGETFSCIIGLQFKHLRSCDRYWFENPFPYMRFTKTQLLEIKKVSLASVTCRNCDLAPTLQADLMDVPEAKKNPKIECGSLHRIDFRHWIDQRGKKDSGIHFCEAYGRIMRAGQSHLRVSGCTECSCPRRGGLATCQTINVGSCPELIREIGEEEVRSEENCLAQCSDALGGDSI